LYAIKTDIYHFIIYSDYCISQYQVFYNDMRLMYNICVLFVTVSAFSCTHSLHIDGIAQ